MPRSALFAAGAALGLLAGCAAQRAAGGTLRVAVLQLKAVGLPPQIAPQTRAAIQRQLAESSEAVVLAEQPLDQALAAEVSCKERGPEAEERCALAVGARLGATHVVVGALGGLGRTFIVQLRVLEVARAAVSKSLEETLFGEPDTLPRAAAQLAVRLVGARRAPPWYGRWWVWTLATLAAGAAVAIPLVLTRGDPPYEDVPLP